ncbi:hypothetical protein GH733_014442 [Mirounga leonina]|nr:hypothetical protein GH733_014442 [Mirounga leonina]
MHPQVSNIYLCPGFYFHCGDEVALQRVSESWLRSARALTFSRRCKTSAEAGSLLGLRKTTDVTAPAAVAAKNRKPALPLRVPGSRLRRRASRGLAADPLPRRGRGSSSRRWRAPESAPQAGRAGRVSLPLGKPPEPSGL